MLYPSHYQYLFILSFVAQSCSSFFHIYRSCCLYRYSCLEQTGISCNLYLYLIGSVTTLFIPNKLPLRKLYLRFQSRKKIVMSHFQWNFKFKEYKIVTGSQIEWIWWMLMSFNICLTQKMIRDTIFVREFIVVQDLKTSLNAIFQPYAWNSYFQRPFKIFYT